MGEKCIQNQPHRFYLCKLINSFLCVLCIWGRSIDKVSSGACDSHTHKTQIMFHTYHIKLSQFIYLLCIQRIAWNQFIYLPASVPLSLFYSFLVCSRMEAGDEKSVSNWKTTANTTHAEKWNINTALQQTKHDDAHQNTVVFHLFSFLLIARLELDTCTLA